MTDPFWARKTTSPMGRDCVGKDHFSSCTSGVEAQDPANKRQAIPVNNALRLIGDVGY